MRILFLTHAFNSLTQQLYVALGEHGHQLSVEFDINDAVSEEAVTLFQPELIIAPFLKRAIPESIWRNHVCLVVHPGIPGDRGPSALDWAILDNQTRWGVTVLQANGEMDGGDIWASVDFPMRAVSKGSLYRNEVTSAALEAVLLAVERFQDPGYKPQPLDYSRPSIRGRQRPLMGQSDRSIDWQRDTTADVVRKIRAADGFPGVRERLFDQELLLFDAHSETRLGGDPGELVARCGPAVCLATLDGAVWIGHMKARTGEHPFKLPATRVLAPYLEGVPEVEADPETGYREIWYERQGEVGYLHFPFYNGAMGTEQCQRLLRAYQEARAQDTRLIVLMGGPDYWSNGMHLNLIEAAESPADESLRNINAINDLAKEIIETDNQLTVAALQGNTGAGGVFLARACDEVWARGDVILNPHYKDMGNLYGSEYWTYLLPRYAGEEKARRIVHARLPMGTREAEALCLVDRRLKSRPQAYLEQLNQLAQAMVGVPAYPGRLDHKKMRRAADESQKPLTRYREEELEMMKRNFYGFDPSYHVARYNFVYKVPKSRTPLTIASHRRLGAPLKRVS